MTDNAGNLLPARQVMDRFHIVSRTLDRWLNDPKLNFPKPLVVNHRRYFYQDQIATWERDRAASYATNRGKDAASGQEFRSGASL